MWWFQDCFGRIGHVTTRTDLVWETGLSDKPDCTQVNSSRGKYMSDRKPGGSLKRQPFILILEQEKSGLICKSPETNGGGV